MSTARQYELVYIMPGETTEQQVADVHTQIEGVVTRFGGTIDNTDNWGRRKLAYEINRQKEGVYVVQLISGSGDLMKELDRRLRVMDVVIRHLLVRVDEDLRTAERAKTRRKDAAARRRAARGLPPLADVPEGEAPEAASDGRDRDQVEVEQ
jgi:small subunit ribosomal protein S6